MNPSTAGLQPVAKKRRAVSLSHSRKKHSDSAFKENHMKIKIVTYVCM
jgi:hypothetical protein